MAIESLSELRAFAAILETGSFTAAARRLGLTVNATSRRLQQLEASVGTKLVERTTRRSSATDAGRRGGRPRSAPCLGFPARDLPAPDAHRVPHPPPTLRPAYPGFSGTVMPLHILSEHRWMVTRRAYMKVPRSGWQGTS